MQFDIAARCNILSMSALHPEDGLQDASLVGRGQAALQAEMPENPAVLNPTCARAEMIMKEIS